MNRIVVAALLVTVTLPPPPQQQGTKVFEAQKVRDNLYVLTGGGGNTECVSVLLVPVPCCAGIGCLT